MNEIEFGLMLTLIKGLKKMDICYRSIPDLRNCQSPILKINFRLRFK